MADARIYALVDTWDNGATTFTALKMNVTDTASAAGSLLMDLQLGGASKEKTDKSGNKTLAGWLTVAGGAFTAPGLNFGGNDGFYTVSPDFVGLTDGSATHWVAGPYGGGIGLLSRDGIGFSTDPRAIAADLILTRDAANTLAQRNGTAAQAFRLYNTFTNAANYERAGLYWTSNILILETAQAGTGAAREMRIATGGNAAIEFWTGNTGRWKLHGGDGHLQAITDNAYDLGAPGANRPRSLYLGTGLGGKSGAAAPTAADIPASQWMLWKNTTDATVKLYYNDAGTLKSVALA